MLYMREKLKNFIHKIPDPAFAIIPNNWEEFFKNTVSVDARSAYRRNKTAFGVGKVNIITDEISQGITDIWKSPTVRQGRPINFNYETVNGDKVNIQNRWAIGDYSAYDFGNTNLELFLCRDRDSLKIVAYIELINCNGVSIIHSTLCHDDYIKRNISRYTFMSMIQQKIPTIKYLIYNQYDKSNPSYHFKEDLGIINHNGIDLLKKEINE